MFKLRNTVIAFIIISVQGFLALSAGLYATHLSTGDSIQKGVYIGDVDIGGLNGEEASAKLDVYYTDIFSKDSLKIIVKDIDEFNIPYSELNADFDSEATLSSVSGISAVKKLRDVMKGYPIAENTYIKPVITFNEGKIRQKLIEKAKLVDKDAQDAALTIIDGKIVKTAETSGLKLNIAKAASMIKDQIEKDPGSAVTLNTYSNDEIEIIDPEIRLRDIEEIEQVIAEYSTDIANPSGEDSIRKAADAIDGLIIPVYDGSGSNEYMEFSFIKYTNLDMSNDNEGYSQVASTLYAALLKAGLKKEAITRLPHELPTEYIEPGLDAWISNNGGDLKFKNTLNNKIAIFAECEGDKLTVRIAGNLRDKKQEEETQLKVDVIQMFEPTIVNIENKDIKKGEKVVLSQGKKGMLVEVYRGQELIGTDKYEAVNEIVQVGPQTDWTNPDNK